MSMVNGYTSQALMKMLAKKKADAMNAGLGMMDAAVAASPGLAAAKAAAVAKAAPVDGRPAPAASPLAPGVPVAGPDTMSQPDKPAPAASPLVPGVPVAGPGVMTPAQINSTIPAPQRIADLQAKESTYRQAIVNPSISPAERMMAKEKVAALAAERRALENSNASGPKFLDASAAANSTQKLLEQTLTQMRDQIGRPEVDQTSLEKRFNDTAAELEKVKSGAYAQEYNSPERVAAREAAMQKHLARQKAYADEANRLADTRMQGEAEVAKQRELKDAAMQAQLAGIQQGTQAGALGNQMTQAQIDHLRAMDTNSGALTQAQKDKMALELKLGDLRRRSEEIDLNDKQAAGPDRQELIRKTLKTQGALADAGQAAAEGQASSAKELIPLQQRNAVDMERARLAYNEAGYMDRGDALSKARDAYESLIKPTLGGWTGLNHEVTGEGWGGSVHMERADKFQSLVMEPLALIARTSPTEARILAKNILAFMPDKDYANSFIGGQKTGDFAARLNSIKAALRAMAAG